VEDIAEALVAERPADDGEEVVDVDQLTHWALAGIQMRGPDRGCPTAGLSFQ